MRNNFFVQQFRHHVVHESDQKYLFWLQLMRSLAAVVCEYLTTLIQVKVKLFCYFDSFMLNR